MPGFRFHTDGITLTRSEQKIIDYIYNHVATIPYQSIDQISHELQMSNATLSRFVRHMGYQSFKELKSAIIDYESTSPANKMNRTLSKSDQHTIAQQLSKEADHLLITKENLSEEDANKAIQAIIAADHIYFLGKGSSEGLAQLFAYRLNRFHKKTTLLKSSGSELFEKLINVTAKDLVIVFGFHKMPVEAKIVLDYSLEIGYKTVVFTDRLYVSSDQCGDINLYVFRGDVNEYHSMTAPTALIDAIILQIAKELKDNSLQNLSQLYQLKEKYVQQIPR